MARWPSNVRPEWPEAPLPRPDDPIHPVDQRIAAIRHAERLKTRTSILFMSTGGILGSVSAGFLWGAPAAGVLLGAVLFIVGLFIGLSS